jgi:hypothetical protein
VYVTIDKKALLLPSVFAAIRRYAVSADYALVRFSLTRHAFDILPILEDAGAIIASMEVDWSVGNIE